MLKLPINLNREPDSDHGDRSVYRKLCLLALAGLIIRLIFALNTENTHRPDEIYQFLEPAHRLVFGYGFITWEYRLGARSWLIPFFVSGPLFLCKFLHLDSPTIYIPLVKSIFCLLSVSVIFSSFVIGKQLISEKAGWLSAIFCTFWYELIYFSFRPLSDVLSTYLVLAAIACLLCKDRKAAPLAFGICTGLSLAIRLQLFPVTILLLALAAVSFNRQQLLQGGAAFISVVVFAGLVDYLTWGQWFISYYNTFLFQWVYKVSTLFGVQEPTYFVTTLFSNSVGVLPLAFLAGFFFWRRLWILILMVLVEIGMHSLAQHKDYRYIFVTVPLLLIIYAGVITLFTELIDQGRMRLIPVTILSLMMLVISVAGFFNKLPGESVVYPFTPLTETQDHKRAFLYLSQAKDVRGVCVIADVCRWYQAGGYYYLHQNVPVYFMGHPMDVAQVSEVTNYWLCWKGDKNLRGFEPVTEIGNLSIRRETYVPRHIPGLPELPPYHTNIIQRGIDDRYKPDVHPFLPGSEIRPSATSEN